MATLETFLSGLAILAVALESHGTTLVVGGLAAWVLTHGGALTENEPPLVDRAPFSSEPSRRLRQTYSSGVLLVLGARTHRLSLIDIRYAPIATKFRMAPN